MALGGRAGEEIHLGGDCTQGAHSDLAAATKLATAMVTEYGMTDLGLTCYEAGQLAADGPVARRIDEHVRALLDEAHERAVGLLSGRLDALRRLAEALLDEEELSGRQVAEIVTSSSGGK